MQLHAHVHRQVTDWFERARKVIHYGLDESSLERDLRNRWEADFESTSQKMLGTRYGEGLGVIPWAEIRHHLSAAVERVQVVVVNQTSKTVLDYDNYKGRGLHVIAVGGDKLSRGLTLEGLLVSYFLRTSTMYDTLMQMGRWFGYREGYADLCRLYMTTGLQQWFRHIAVASEELRAQFNHMALTGGKPTDYGLRIASHDVMAVTAANKMRAGYEVQVSFAGQVKIQTVFDRDAATIRSNFNIFDDFLKLRMQAAERNPPRPRSGTARGRLWRAIPGREIAALLAALRYSEEAYDVNARLSAIAGAAVDAHITLPGQFTIHLVRRTGDF